MRAKLHKQWLQLKKLLLREGPRRLLHDSASGFLLKVAATGIAFLASLIYARALGPEQYGYYVLVVTWMLMLQLVGNLGLNDYLVREVAKAETPGQAHWLLRWAQRRCLLLLLGLEGLILLWLHNADLAEPYPELVLIGLCVPFINIFTGLRLGVLRGWGEIVIAQVPQLVFGPLIMLILLLLAWAWFGQLDARITLVSVVLSALAAALLSHELYRRRVPQVAAQRSPAMLRYALPFMLWGGLNFLNARLDQLVVGVFLGPTPVGIYALSARVAEIVTFASLGFEYALGPRIARFYSGGDNAALREAVGIASRGVFVAALVVALPLGFGARPLMGLAFGSEFSAGGEVVGLLLLGHMLRFVFGPCALVLNMTDHARLTTQGLVLGLLVNLVLDILLVPWVGIEGAAVATVVSYLASSAYLHRQVSRHLGFSAGIVGTAAT